MGNRELARLSLYLSLSLSFFTFRGGGRGERGGSGASRHPRPQNYFFLVYFITQKENNAKHTLAAIEKKNQQQHHQHSFLTFFYRSLINYLTLMLECRNEKRARAGLSFLVVCLLFVIVYLLTKLERHLCTPKTSSVALCFFVFFSLSLFSLSLSLFLIDDRKRFNVVLLKS